MSISEYDVIRSIESEMCDDCQFHEACQEKYEKKYHELDLYQLTDCIYNGFKPKFEQYRLYNCVGNSYRDFLTMEAAKKYQEDNYSKNRKFATAIKDRLTGIIYGLVEIKPKSGYDYPVMGWVELSLVKDREEAAAIARQVDAVDKEDDE